MEDGKTQQTPEREVRLPYVPPAIEEEVDFEIETLAGCEKADLIVCSPGPVQSV